MALKLIAPGKRGGNRFYLARGWLNGRLYEYSLKTTDLRAARRSLREFEQSVLGEGPQPKGHATFAAAAARYQDYRTPSAADARRIKTLVAKLGARRLRDITVAELHDLANRLKPGQKGSTKNRDVLAPAFAILNHAAETGLCAPLKTKRFPDDSVSMKAVDRGTAAALVKAAPAGPKRLLLLWLFHQGMRITHTLNVTWDRVDLSRGTVEHREIKGRRPRDWTFPLHGEVLDELRCTPPEARTGRVFPWKDRHRVYEWLGPLAAQVGIAFTPHMARHSRGTWLNDEGAGPRTIMEALGHASIATSQRYQHGNLEVVRAVGARISLKGTVA